jgi:hypothetical protein
MFLRLGSAGSNARMLTASGFVDPSFSATVRSGVKPRSSSPGAPRRKTVAPQGVHALILLQSADGSWELTDQFALTVNRDLDTLRAAVVGAVGAEADVLRAWATALAVAWLELNAADTQGEWSLLALKARHWLERTAAIPPESTVWSEAAQAFLAGSNRLA